jgi:fido (protein-threonine AMPylation protein)
VIFDFEFSQALREHAFIKLEPVRQQRDRRRHLVSRRRLRESAHTTVRRPCTKSQALFRNDNMSGMKLPPWCPKLTEGALEKMLRGEADTDDDEPIFLQILGGLYAVDCDDYLAYDGSGKTARVRLLVTKNDSSSRQPPPRSIILVRGYVVSSANAAGLVDLLCFVTAWDVIRQIDEVIRTFDDSSLLRRLPASKTVAGNAYDFFSTTAHFLSNADIAGALISQECHEQQEAVVSQFLEHDKAMKTISKSLFTLHGSAPTNTTSASPSSESVGYLSAQADFIKSQVDRQSASLTSNTGRHNAETSAKVAHQHGLCLEAALSSNNDESNNLHLTPALLCSWHKILCGDGLHQHAGVVRPKNVHVRIGQVSFRPSSQVGNDLNALCQALTTLESRLLRNLNSNSGAADSNNNRNHSTELSRGLAAVTFAAAVLYGIVDTHAFADGNGRIARIASNWALQRAGLPFCLHLFATPAQRKEYVTAVITTRRNLSLVAKGDVPQGTLLSVYRNAGCLQPLVVLIMDRVYKAVTEFSKLVQEKSTMAADQDEARAARIFRERAAGGNCLM